MRGKAKRIIVLCEGKTEEKAVEHFIRPQWQKDGFGSVGLDTRELRGKFEHVSTRVPIHLRKPGVLAVFTLIDLYGMNRVVHGSEESVHDKVERVRAWLRKDFDSDLLQFFHPHLSVHELEAWLLADGNCIHPGRRPDRHAEDRDFIRPPKTRIDEILKKRRNATGYNEVIDGTAMFKRARFDVIYPNCPYFKAFYDDLKEVAQRALADHVQ